MQVLEAMQGQQRSAHLQSLLVLAALGAATSPDMRVAELEEEHLSTGQLAGTGHQTSGNGVQVQLSALDRAAQEDAAVLGIEELRHKYGQPRADRAIAVVQSQVSTARQVFAKHRKHELEGKRELGRGLAAAGIQVQHHSVPDYTRVILAQLDSFLEGVILSDSALLRIAFPDDPAKAKSIGNSRNGKRYKQAWGSPAVMNHPMEKSMQRTHNRHDMNRRLTARSFGQCLSMNASLFKSSDRITKLEALVQLLEQQMQATKQREALADAGATSSRDKVLALSDQGKKPTEIAKQLDMPRNTVCSIIRRSKNR